MFRQPWFPNPDGLAISGFYRRPERKLNYFFRCLCAIRAYYGVTVALRSARRCAEMHGQLPRVSL